jgi:hypothetical protein
MRIRSIDPSRSGGEAIAQEREQPVFVPRVARMSTARVELAV